MEILSSRSKTVLMQYLFVAFVLSSCLLDGSLGSFVENVSSDLHSTKEAVGFFFLLRSVLNILSVMFEIQV